MKCEYCGNQEAKYQFKNGKWCCSKNIFGCRSKNQKGEKNHAYGKSPWNKGLTKDIDERVKNNCEKANKTRNDLIKEGKLIVWNKGLTAKTDERVKKYTEIMKKERKGKPNFKNRKPIEQSKAKCRGHFRHLFKKGLYIDWIYPIMVRDNFVCVRCGSNKNLEVHHSVKPYREIFDECVLELNLNIEDWMKWDNKIIEDLHKLILKRHELNNGITLCKNCHCLVDNYRKQFKRNEDV